ncbi:putative sporulation protein YtxC [Paenibacillus abyssi]|uniref:Sporulation protein n=1 Tax=Paenibacillus abyssi TaxID=1340531 RepID=A0A917CTE4_9BACL|nr:putative sporulation protein YtxC [Paenibacillus abyssi]GGF97085.1 hypothetical protein GCM10010916_12940 [Paenibacillus abyssi]
MELFKVTLISADEQKIWRLSRYLSDAFAELHTSGCADDLQWNIDVSSGEICCLMASSAQCTAEDRAAIMRRAAQGLSEYVLVELEPELLRAIIRKDSGYEEQEDLDKIERYCIQMLNVSMDSCSIELDQQDDRTHRKEQIAEEIIPYLLENIRINLNGFITFRLANYRESLREIVEYAVDEYVMEKQYQDFISLLRYFVGLQDTKTPIVHLLQREDGQFQLCNHQFLPLEYRQSDRIVAEMLESEMNIEDRVVSSLIAASPKQIVIHTCKPEQQVIRTIESIFYGRVTVCEDSLSYNPIMLEQIQPKDHRYT